MHKALQIPELVLEIVRCLDRHKYKLCFGLTCHANWRIAVSEIWYDVEIDALQYLIPNAGLDPCEQTESRLRATDETSKWVKTDCTHDSYEDMPLFHYARLIRRLRLYEPTPSYPFLPPECGSAIMTDIQHYVGSKTAFPQLKALSLLFNNSVSPTLCTWLIARPLEDIRIAFLLPIRANIVTTLIDMINDHTNVHMHTFSLCLHHKEDRDSTVYERLQLEDSVAALIYKHPSLTSLTLPWRGTRSCSLLSRAAALPALKRLQIQDASATPHPLKPGAFPSLMVLSLGYSWEYTSVEDCSDLLEAISSPWLSEFSLSSSPRCDDLVHDKVLQILARKWSSSLRKILLDIPRPDHDIKFQCFMPLLGCKGMEYLWIQGPRKVILLDEDCDAVSTAWSRLRGLWFPSGVGSRFSSGRPVPGVFRRVGGAFAINQLLAQEAFEIVRDTAYLRKEI